MSYILEFKNHAKVTRERILAKEIKKNVYQHGMKIDEDTCHQFAEEYPINGGYIPQILKLAQALSKDEEAPKNENLRESFEHFHKISDENRRDNIKNPLVNLRQIVLNKEQEEEVQLFIEYAQNVLHMGKVRSPLMPQGATAIFSGPPGTGKTITAEAIAKELGLKFRRVGPSTLLSAYVGETEKNIRNVFREAEEGSYMLFIDEAEGLFADRSGANQTWEITQINELLNSVEEFRGVLVVATNQKKIVDSAFSRRFLFNVIFELPDYESRLKIWQQWFDQISLAKKNAKIIAGKYELSGGEIRNICVQAMIRKVKDIKALEKLILNLLENRTGESKILGFAN